MCRNGQAQEYNDVSSTSHCLPCARPLSLRLGSNLVTLERGREGATWRLQESWRWFWWASQQRGSGSLCRTLPGYPGIIVWKPWVVGYGQEAMTFEGLVSIDPPFIPWWGLGKTTYTVAEVMMKVQGKTTLGKRYAFKHFPPFNSFYSLPECNYQY